MGFWQHMVESYDKNADILKELYPLSTTSISNNSDMIAIVVIDGDGEFVGFDKIEKKSKPTKKSSGYPLVNVTIPASEESVRRTSTAILPYPLFDQFEYLRGSGRKNDVYIAQLRGFAKSPFATDQVRAIYQYASKRTIACDLSGINMKDKTYVLFRVEIPGCPKTKMWEDGEVFNAWHQYYLSVKGDAKSLDYVSGTVQPTASSHPKKISNRSANAKLVSDNDKTNYTFRGKFAESSEAVSIGYETTQKAHQFLRYLINDRGCYCGEQVILSFTIGSMEELLPPPIEDESIWGILQESHARTANDMQIDLRAETGFDYADALRGALAGFGHGKTLEQHAKTVVVALAAATKGRLSITFYRELDEKEYLEKIAEWHSTSKWHQAFWGEEKERYIPFVGAPSVDRIIEAVHGKPRGGKDESYIRIKKAARERLLRCIFDGALVPRDYVTAAVRRASNPMGVTRNGKFDRRAFQQIVSTACALVRKDHLQRNREGFTLSVELDRTDRDYLFGRLLGAADKLEEYALFKGQNDRLVTAAIRHMQAFAQRPFRTWQTIHGCLNPYIQKVKGSFAFDEIQAVMAKFESGDYENDSQLNGSYLIGYYHERAYIKGLVEKAANKKNSTERTEMEDNDDRQ